MKRCPNCHEWIGDNADVCFNCNYDYISKKVVAIDLFKQRQEQSVSAIRQKENQRIAEARAIADRRLVEDKQRDAIYRDFQQAHNATTKSKIALNDLYEYDVVRIKDKPTGETDILAIQSELGRRSREGWRLINSFTNELGVNAASIAGFGTNATVEETVLIFERCIKRNSTDILRNLLYEVFSQQ